MYNSMALYFAAVSALFAVYAFANAETVATTDDKSSLLSVRSLQFNSVNNDEFAGLAQPAFVDDPEVRRDCSDAVGLLAHFGGGLRVVSPGSAAFERDRRQYASNLGTQQESDDRLHPRFILHCMSEDDVVYAVNWARRCGSKISIRSGGHQYAGLSSCEKGSHCVQLDVSQLENFEYDEAADRLTLGVGLELQQVWQKLLPLGLALPMGVCNTVNVGGHLQSSSQGFFGRAEGLGMDHVVSVRIVLADGSVKAVSRDSTEGCLQGRRCERNLFWAVLGGGPGSWGVVLEYTVKPVHNEKYPHAANMRYVWPYEHDVFVEMVKQLREVNEDPKYERDLFLLLVVTPIEKVSANPDLAPLHRNNPRFHYIVLNGFWSGGDNGPMDSTIQKETLGKVTAPAVKSAMNGPFAAMLDEAKLATLPVHAIFGAVQSMPLGHALSSLNTNFDQLPGYRYHVHSMSSAGTYDAVFAERAADEIDKRLAAGMYSSFQYQPYGGAQHNGGRGSQVNLNGDGRNAFPMRDLTIHVDDWVFFDSDQKADEAAKFIQRFRNDTKRFWEAEGSADNSFMTTSAFEEDEDPTKIELLADYFPSPQLFWDLVRVKHVVDEQDLFHSATTIPPMA